MGQVAGTTIVRILALARRAQPRVVHAMEPPLRLEHSPGQALASSAALSDVAAAVERDGIVVLRREKGLRPNQLVAFMQRSACLPSCLAAWLPGCLPACLSAFLPACLPAFLPACSACLPAAVAAATAAAAACSRLTHRVYTAAPH